MDWTVGGRHLRSQRMWGISPAKNCYYNSMKVKEMLLYTAELYGVAGHNRMEALAERLNLDLSRRIGDLSLGNKKKVGIVSALLPSPKLLIMDEPTSGLDPLIQQTFYDLLKEENERGTTIFPVVPCSERGTEAL